MSRVISQSALRSLVDQWLHDGVQVIGPRRIERGALLFERLTSAEALVLDGQTRCDNSIKEVVFPRHETLYRYRMHGKQIELSPADAPPTQVVIGARPCDAAALPILDHVFNWDFPDPHYNLRRQATTVVTLACQASDAHCFCSSVGLGPDHPQGSDVLLYDLGDGTYEVRPQTEKGEALFAGLTDVSQRVGAACAPPPAVDLTHVQAFLEGAFERPEWALWAARCLGCGACACTCPTCHCFDIVDEGTASTGARVRNWDACQHGLFTLHASGHNPRGNQAQRQRQRIYHKFRVYPEKFGPTLCTGCGNCTRNCPVGLGVRSVLDEIAAQSR